MIGWRDSSHEPGRGRADLQLEAGYRRLLALYPARHRRVHQEEMLAVLLTAARAGQRRPGLADALDLVAGAVRVRCQPVSKGEPAWRRLLAGPGTRGRGIIVISLAVVGLAAGIAAVRPQPYASSDVVLVGDGSKGGSQGAAAVATSRQVFSYARRRLGLHVPVSSWWPGVRATVLTDHIVTITARGVSPGRATRAVTAVTMGLLHVMAINEQRICRSDARASGAQAKPCVRRIADTQVLPPVLRPHTSLVAAGTESGGIGLAAGLLAACLVVISGAAARKPSRAT